MHFPINYVEKIKLFVINSVHALILIIYIYLFIGNFCHNVSVSNRPKNRAIDI
jgi:hypothetical protein